jgi:hypothetical protein
MTEISKTGKWVDNETGQVVDSEPENGKQLVAPGGEVTPQVQAAIEAAEAAAPDVPDEEESGEEESGEEESSETEESTEEQATEPPAPEKATSNRRLRR